MKKVAVSIGFGLFIIGLLLVIFIPNLLNKLIDQQEKFCKNQEEETLKNEREEMSLREKKSFINSQKALPSMPDSEA